MSVNPHPTHAGWWQIKYYPNGKKGGLRVETLRDCTKEEALEYEIIFRKSVSESKLGIGSLPTVYEAIPFFMEHYKLEHLPSGVPVMRRYMERWGKYLQGLRFAHVNTQRIEAYKHERLSDGVKPNTINKELSALSVLFAWASEVGYCDPLIIKRFPNKLTKSPLPDVPTREEVLAVLNCMIWPRCGLFFCLYYGGMRSGEAKGLTAESVHLDRGVMIVRGKGNKQRMIPIVNQLRPHLEKRLGEVTSGLLWTTKSGMQITDLKKIIKLAKERAGVTRHIYPHLLRHAFGTHATMAGVGMRQLQGIMGHTSVSTTEIYTTLGSEALSKELVGKFGK